jgi:hypothetical protein
MTESQNATSTPLMIVLTLLFQTLKNESFQARCSFQLETINMFTRQLFVLSATQNFKFLPEEVENSQILQIIKVQKCQKVLPG